MDGLRDMIILFVKGHPGWCIKMGWGRARVGVGNPERKQGMMLASTLDGVVEMW